MTGAGRGLGRAIAERFVSEGARVAIVDIDADSAVEAAANLGEHAVSHGADIADQASVERGFSAAIDWLGVSRSVSSPTPGRLPVRARR